MARITAQVKSEVRKRLLDTAARHFAEAGFDRTSVDAVSIGAGYAKGTLYNYFRSKEELFGAVIEQGARQALARAAEPPDSGTLRDRLLALARADVEVLRSDEAFTKVLVREAMSFRPETHALILEHLGPFLARIEQIVGAAARRGEIGSAHPASELALLYTGILSLFYVQHWGSDGAWPALDDIPELAVDAFLYGATGSPATGA